MTPDPSYREIPLTQGKVALVDSEDYDRIAAHKWCASKQKRGYWYAFRRTPGPRNTKKPTIYMHREILGLEFGDPRNGDHICQAETLDNRKQNLRIATHTQNQQNQRLSKRNKTGFKGVRRGRTAGYQANIVVNGKQKYLAQRKSAEDCARIYDVAAITHFGEFASLNFPKSDYDHLFRGRQDRAGIPCFRPALL